MRDVERESDKRDGRRELKENGGEMKRIRGGVERESDTTDEGLKENEGEMRSRETVEKEDGEGWGKSLQKKEEKMNRIKGDA